jgi:folate-binding protein YgfZ
MSGSPNGLRFVRRSRTVVAVHGPDAEAYLQGQLSQDVAALSDGASAWTFVLQPAGKVDAWLRVTRRGDGDFLLDVDAGHGEVLEARLGRFLLRTDCTIERLDWEVATLIGSTEAAAPAGGVAVVVDWAGVTAIDLLGPAVSPPEAVEEVGAEAWEQVRVAAGIPEMGSEIDQETMPGATGQVERSVSFTKGCYTGQELVARVDSRTAGAPTRLVLVDGSGEAPVVGAQLWSPDGQVGHLTSTVPVGDGFVALGYRKRSALDLDEAEVRWEGGSTPVRLRTA